MTGENTADVVRIGLRYGVVLFILSEVMFFVAFFWAFLDASLFATEEIQFGRVEANGGQWPPAHIETFDPINMPHMNTQNFQLSGC